MGHVVMRLFVACLVGGLGQVAWSDGVLDGRIGEPYGSTRAIDAAGNDTEGDGECHATGGRGDVMDFHALSMPGSSATNAAWWFAWTVDSSRDLNATSGDFFGNPSTMTVNYLIGIEVNCDGAPRMEMWQNGQAWEREFAWNVDYFIAMYPDGVNSMRAQLWRNDGSNLRTQIGGEFSVTSRVSGFRRQVELTLPADLAGLPVELRNNSTLCMYLVSVENSEPTGRVIDGVGLNSLVLVNGVNCSTTGFDLTAAGIQFINSQALGKAGGRPTDPGVNDRQTLSNGRRDTTASVTCPNCPETGFAVNGQVKPQYQLLTEAGFAAPYVGGSTSASDFIGESSARSITLGTTGSTNTTVLVGSFNHGDVANVYAYGDARYLYVLVSGPGALGWDNEPDRMNVYLALDVVGRNSNNDSATTNTLNDRFSNSGALGPTAPGGRLVNFKGWDPDYVVELVWRGVTQGVDAPANLYAANGTIGNWSLATTFLYQDVADTLSALVRPYYSRTFQQYEFAIPWTNLGFATVPAPTNRFRLAAYTTADENTGGVSAWDVADSAPGIGQGPTGLGAHERVGDDALDTDFLDAVDGLGDFAPFVGRSFGAPGFEPATDNTGFDVDTLEEFFVWSLDITTCAQLGDFVWHDANLDGVQSGGETGVAGVVIRLLSNGVAVASTTSSVSGAYAFTNLVPFTNYVVEFVRPSGMYFTALQAGGNTNLDSNADPVNGRSSAINLGSGETNRTVDAGLVFGASLGDFVWHDVNRDGVQNGGETGFPATVVRLLSNGVTVASTTTTVSGAYAFTNLPPFTNYAIEVAAPVGAAATLVFQGGNTNLDSNIDAVTLRSDSVTLGSGQSNNTIDAGFFYPARLGDFIWHDTNLNGIQDGSETGMPGVVVRLLSNGVAIATTTSSVSGAYAFTNLAPFTNYVIEVVPPVNAFVPTPFQGGNTNVDSNIDAVTLRSDVVILLSGQNNPSIDAGLFFNLPGIDIEKATNGQDADTPTGPILSVGAPVTWTYVVRNTGNVGVTNVVVYDSDIGFVTNLVSGDLNGNRVIETNETWTYTASGFAVSGQYDNLGAVTGRSVVATNTVSDTDPSHYFGASGAIDIEKATNGQDADTPTGPTVAVGSNVTWTYVVRNTGNVGVTNVVVYDSDIGFITNLVSGDLNNNRVIETNETWTYTASGIAVAGQYANLGSVTGVTVSTGSPVTDQDPSHYFGSQPGIVIEKATNGQDADNAPGPTLGIGSAVTWTYAVTNTGNVALTNVVVTDDRVGAITNRLSGDVNSNGLLDVGEVWIYSATGTVVAGQYVNTGLVNAVSLIGQPVNDTDPSHHFGASGAIDIEKATNGQDADTPTGPTVAVGSGVTWTYVVRNTGNVGVTNVVVYDSDLGFITNLVSGDLNGNRVIETNETWTYTASGIAVAGQYANLGSVTGVTVSTGSQVTDQDPSHYFGSQPGVVIEKATNGQDADTAPGPTLGIGSAVTWTYAVTNTGNVALTNVVVTDDRVGTITNRLSGDVNGNGLLDVGEVWIYSATGTVVAGQYVNTGLVNAVSLIGQPVNDTDPSHHFGASGTIDIEKATNGQDADTPTGPTVAVGSGVTWTYVVRNTGNIGITNVVVYDSDIGFITNLVSGDLNNNRVIETNETWTYTASGIAVAGQYANLGSVTGVTISTGSQVTDTDPSHYFGSQPGVVIEKATNGQDADNAPGPTLGIGSAVTWTYAVTNTGNVALTNVVVTDDRVGAITNRLSGDVNSNGLLDVGEVWIYSATGTVVAGQYVNTGLVNAVSLIGQPVNDTDPSHYFGASGAIDIEKATNGQDADTPTGPTVAVGSNVTWTYVVRNTGNIGVTNVVVYDSDIGFITNLVSGDLNGNRVIETNETWTYTASGIAVAGQYANLGSVTGVTISTGSQVTDTDPSHYFGSQPGIVIEKATNGQDADNAPGPTLGIGSVVTWTYAVTNTGNVALTNVVVTDDRVGAITNRLSGDVNSNGLLDVGEVWIYSATGTVVAGQYVNTGLVNAVSLIGQPVNDTDPSHHFGASGAIDIEKATNGQDADTPTGPTVAVGSGVTWTYVVRNTGNIGITNVVVYDSDIGFITNLVSGDLNGNRVIETNETWTYTASGIAVAGQYANLGSVTGVTISTGSQVTDQDPSHYFGSQPGIVIEKATNGQDADIAPGPTLGIGSAVTWTYAVTNTGNVALTNVVVTDDRVGAITNRLSGDVNSNGLLDVGEVWIYSATGTVVAGQYVNTGLVNAVSLIGQPVNDTDPSHHFGASGAIDIEKATNGQDADTPTGPTVAVGSNVTWTYVVRNTGNIGITNVVVYDSDIGFITNLVSGDLNGNRVIETNETWTYSASGIAVAGQYANLGSVTGVTVSTGSQVTDQDPSHYFGSQPGIVIEKATNGQDADNAPGPTLGIGSAVTWTYAVTNTGNVALTNVVVTDDRVGAITNRLSGDVNSNGLLDVGEVWIYSATGTVVAGQYVNTGLVNAVSLIGQPVNDTDPSHHFGASGAIDIEKATNGQDADTPTGPTVAVGSNVTWTYVVRNTGNIGITNVVVYDSDIGFITNLVSGDLNNNRVIETNETWTYTANGIAVAGQYANLGSVTGVTVSTGSQVTDTDPSHYFGSQPGIVIEKATNGQDADTAPGPTLGIGSAVTWTFAVTNTGNVALTNVVLTDDRVGAITNRLSGDLNSNGLLDVGEVWIYSATGTVVAGQYVNTGLVNAVSLIGQPVNDTDPSHHFGASGAIDIEKATNGQDADTPTGPTVAVGSGVTWTYVVRNTGNIGVTNVVVYDSDIGFITNLVSGDLNNNRIIETNETWTYTASGIAVAGQYANLGSVTGVTVSTGSPVTDTDPSHYFGSQPGIVIEKATNGQDADNAPGPTLGIGSAVTWTYAVTNTGNVALTNVVVTDDRVGAITNRLSGDVNSNGLLDVGEVWIYSATGTVVAGQYVNTGLVNAVSLIGQPVNDTDPSHHFGASGAIDIEKATNGQDADTPTGPTVAVGSNVTWTYVVRNTGNIGVTNVVVYDSDIGFITNLVSGDLNNNRVIETNETWTYSASGLATAGQYANLGSVTGVTVSTGSQVTDQDPSHYFGSQPGIVIEKATNGQDADTAPGPTLGIGSAVTWTYAVTNTGNVALTNVVVTDDRVGAITNRLSGDVNSNGLLDVGEVWIYSATGTVVAGQYVNTGLVNAVSLIGQPVNDTDPSHHFGASGAIDIEKATNGQDADTPTGPTVAVGSGVTWTYVVRNTGNIGVTNVVVYDSDIGFITNLVSGDLNGNRVIETNETWTYTASGIAVAGQYANLGSVTGVTISTGSQVTDTDPSHYFGSQPGIVIEKATNGQDADNAPGPTLGIGSAVTWTYAVTNTGNVALTNVVVTDDRVGAITNRLSGDVNSNGLLDVGEVWIYSATGTVVAGQYVNTGLVNAVSLIGQPVTDTDPSHHFGASGAIDIEKATNGQDADTPTGPTVAVGSGVTWTYVVRNTGNIGVTNVVVYDSDIGFITNLVSGDLNGNRVIETNETWTYTASGIAVAGQYANLGSVTGVTVSTGSPVTDSDPSHYFGSQPGIVIEKATNGQDADIAPGPTLGIGSAVTWTYAVTNTGNVALTNVVVTDDRVGAITNRLSGDVNSNGLLDVGEVWIYSATGTVVAGQYVNTGLVNAVSLIGQPVNDTDPSHHFGASGAIDIEKATNGQDADTPTGPTVAVGSGVTWTYVVRNTGNIGVTNVVVYDSDIGFITNLISGDLNGNRVIETNETWTYTVSGIAVAGQYANLGSVTGVTVSTGSPVTDSDPSHYFGQTAGYTLVKQVLSPTNRAAAVGELITFRLTVQNTGDVTLVTVPLEDRYHLTELSFVSSVPAPTDGLDDGILNWANLGPLTRGSSTSVVVTFVAVGSTEGLSRTNTVIARPTTPPGDQPVPPQTNDAPYRISAPGFALSKTLLAPTNRPAILGESITFRITIANTGDVTLVTVPLRDRYETNYLAFVSAVPPPVNSTNDGVLDWSNLGPLPPGASTSVVATFRAVGLPPSIVRTNTVIASPTTPTNEPPVPPATNDAPYRIAVITIGDTVWVDVNSNGIHDEDLSIFGLNGVRVDLYNIVDGVTNFVDFRLPGPNHGNLGFYQFTNLPVIGTYVAEVVLSFIPPGLPVTTTPLLYTLDTSVVFTNGGVQYADFGFNNQFGTPIELVSFSGRPSPEGIELAWETAWESDTLGFHLYRTSGSGEQDPVRVTDAVIPGEGAEVGAAYRWLDRASGLEGLLRYWLVEVALNGEEAWYGPVVVYAGELDVEHALASFTQPAGTGELARLTGTTLMQAGVPISQLDLERLMVEVDGRAVARLISAERVSMLPDDYLLFYLPPSSEARRIAVRLARDEETVPAMAWVYARPRGGAGDVGVTPVENGRSVLATYQPGLVRMFVPGFVNPAIWILDVTDASMPSLLYGFATVADDQQGAYAVYLSLDSTQDQTLLFVEQDAILDIDSVDTGD